MILRFLAKRLLLVTCIAIGCLSTLAASAGAYGIHSFKASYSEAPLSEAEAFGPSDFQAGSHPYQFTASVAFNTYKNAEGEELVEGYTKDLQIQLPRGVVGSLSGLPQCPQTVFMSFGVNLFGENSGVTCPADTQVGVLTLNGARHALYNLVPPAGVAGELGTSTLIAPLYVDLSIRSGSDYGLTAEIRNLTQIEEVNEISFTLWGVPADPGHDHLRCLALEKPTSESCPSSAAHEPALTLPSSCTEPLTTKVVAQPWADPESSAESSVTATNAVGQQADVSGCDLLHFDPSVTVRSESAVADSPAGLSIDVHVPFLGAPTELAGASLENLAVALPEGMSINAATAGGLIGCTESQIALGQATAPSCPDSSEIGTLELQTPITSKALTGHVYLAQPPSGLFSGTMTIYLVGSGEGLNFKLPGELIAQQSNGQLTLILDNVPEVPLSELRVNLYGGPRGAIANPAACSAFTTTSELTPYSSTQATTRSNDLTIDEGCAGGFAPSFRAGATSAAAGRETSFAFQVARSDGQQYLQTLTATLPAGEMANISSVPQCGDGEATAGTCPAASQIGTIATGAGAGTDPFYLNGRVYLTGPYAGAPFGVSIVIRALAGPFDLGTVVVRGKIVLDLATSSLTIATDAFPTILQGIPLRIKSLELSIDRPGFMVNPTACAEAATDGTVVSTAGFNAPVSAPFGVSGCSGLLFAPKLAAATLANGSSRAKGASLNVKITDAASVHANLKSLSIKLPKALKPRMIAIQQACLQATFVSNPGGCPAASVVGNAVVDTPTLSAPLTGPVYLVFHRGAKYPGLVLVLQGDGVGLQLKGTVEINKGISTTTFGSLPDIAISLFELNLPEGSHSLLGATESLCAKQRTMLDALDGQNEAKREGAVKTVVEGCSAQKGKAAGRRGAKVAKHRRAKAAAGRIKRRSGR
jgi:hypothetical protein